MPFPANAFELFVASPEGIILLQLAVAHLLGDFAFQTDRAVRNKQQLHLIAHFWHGILHAALAYLLVGVWHSWPVPLAVFLTHLPADWCKEAFAHWFAPCDAEDRPTVRWRLAALLLDQSVHLVLLTMIVVYLPAWDVAMAPGLGADFFGDLWPKLLALTAGAVLSVFAGNVVIGLAVESLLAEMRQPKMHGEVDGQRRGFENGGKYIGQLERALILLFVLAGQPQGVGFLVAAKSVFRFGDLKEHRDRMEAEYIIIGTMLSFGWGLAVALLTQRVLQGQ